MVLEEEYDTPTHSSLSLSRMDGLDDLTGRMKIGKARNEK